MFGIYVGLGIPSNPRTFLDGLNFQNVRIWNDMGVP